MSLALVPSTSGSANIAHASTSTLNSHGLHDTLAYGPLSIASEIAPKHPLEQRLTQWKDTQDELKFTLQRQLYGLHMPVRQLMERHIVAQSHHMPARGIVNNLHLEILTGNDELLETKDIFLGDQPNLPLDIHKDMERKLRL